MIKAGAAIPGLFAIISIRAFLGASKRFTEFFSSHMQNLLALLLQIKAEQRAAHAADDVHEVGNVILHQQHTVQLLA